MGNLTMKMKTNNIIKSLLCILMLFQIIKAQITGYSDNFEDGVLENWFTGENQPTFTLSEVSGNLNVVYEWHNGNDEGDSSWVWDHFRFEAPEIIDASSVPYITFRAKCNTSTDLNIKPVHENGASHFVSLNIPGNNEWNNYEVKMSYAENFGLTQIFCYLNGGEESPDSAILMIDDFKIGDSTGLENNNDLTALYEAINNAYKLKNNSVEGTGEGQYPVGSKTTLQYACYSAESIYLDNESTQSEVNNAVWDIYDAMVNFEKNVNAFDIGLTDNKATKETRYLYANMERLSSDHLIWGMHDATGYGVGWRDDNDRSDVRDVCGSYPAIYSWDANKICLNEDWPDTKYRITEAFNRGGINTICWHQKDPQGRHFYSENVNYENIVETILPGGEYHDFYKNTLHNLALFYKSLRGEKGQSIPIIFRPYHEHTGGWFWWGQGQCTTEEYIELWQFTTHYLRDSLNVHNLIYAISPSANDFNNEDTYFNIYPGDDYVDIYGFDFYFRNNTSEAEVQQFKSNCQVVSELSMKYIKLCAVTEVGEEAIPTLDWFTRGLLAPIKDNDIATRISYAAVWRNSTTSHHYAPYPGHSSVPDFMNFFNDPYTLFEDNLPAMYSFFEGDSVPPIIYEYPDESILVYDTNFQINLKSNERSYFRYSKENISFENMEFDFDIGEGGFIHSTTINGNQGEQFDIFIRAQDLYGNISEDAVIINITIDTTLCPVDWNDPEYVCDNWNTGNASFTFENVNPGRTTYFRKSFMASDSLEKVVALIKRDNGAVVYLNGTEISRVNMPTGEINYETWANNSADNLVTLQFEEECSLLVEGENILAVEIHQSVDDSLDMYFDLQLFSPDILIPFGAEWEYYDEGNSPDIQTISAGLDDENIVASEFFLSQNYPNPFNPTTTINYVIPNRGMVELSVYNLIGERVRQIVKKKQNAGKYSVTFNGSNLSSGIYFYQIKSGNNALTRKMILMK